MDKFYERITSDEKDPQAFKPAWLIEYAHNTFRRALEADEHADEHATPLGDNGRFTHQEILKIEGDIELTNVWRIDLRPPYGGQRKKYKAQVYISLDPSIDVLGGEPFDMSGSEIFVREHFGDTHHPLVRIDKSGAYSVETVDTLSVDKILATSKNVPVRRAEAIYKNVTDCNITASVL